MDDLKRYLQQQRERLDTEEPGEVVWEQVRQVLHPKKVKTIPLYIKWMAAACIVAMAGIAIYISIQNKTKDRTGTPVVAGNKHQHIDSNHKQAPTPEDIQPPVAVTTDKENKDPAITSSPLPKRKAPRPPAPVKKTTAPPAYGFEAVEASYASMLGIQLERLRNQPIYAENAEYFHSFKKEFVDLGNEEEQVKRRIKDNGMRDEDLDDLISIYQEKINVLKQLQFEINKMNNRVKQADPSINRQQPSYINL
jgi:hypothetical protein